MPEHDNVIMLATGKPVPAHDMNETEAVAANLLEVP
jgi:hypothetical protein